MSESDPQARDVLYEALSEPQARLALFVERRLHSQAKDGYRSGFYTVEDSGQPCPLEQIEYSVCEGGDTRVTSVSFDFRLAGGVASQIRLALNQLLHPVIESAHADDPEVELVMWYGEGSYVDGDIDDTVITDTLDRVEVLEQAGKVQRVDPKSKE